MTAPDTSSFRILGLGPGADSAAVEAAYRELIKRYHPDREGGDAERAAEINRAYQQIRSARRLPNVRRTGQPVVQRRPRRRTGGGGRMLGFTLAVALGAFAFVWGGLDLLLDHSERPVTRLQPVTQAAIAPAYSEETTDEPLDTDAIDRAVSSAERLFREDELDRLAGQSRRCHEQLQRAPNMARLDQCVAFDEAASLLVESSNMQVGQFSTAAVTGRQLSAARLFADDYLLLESRLDRIRTRVELSLAPPDPMPAAPYGG